MRVDDMPCARNKVVLRAVACSRIESWDYCSRLVRRICAVAAAKHIVILPNYYVDWSSEFCRRCNDGTEGEKLANAVGLFRCNSISQDYEVLATGNVSSSRRLTFRVKVGVAEKGELNALLSGLGQIAISNALEFS